MYKETPAVLVIAGLDPSGGAGIQADIQTLSALNCHCTPVISTLTIQDSRQLYRSAPVDSDIISEQLRALGDEFNYAGVKIGALGSAENAVVVGLSIQTLRRQNSRLPIVLDPVISAGGGGKLGDDRLLAALLGDVIPYCSLITPNAPELNALAAITGGQETADIITSKGVSILVTGGHTRESEKGLLVNRLVTNIKEHNLQREWIINRCEGEFRGTGCTLASAIAGFMAKGLKIDQAIEKAQQFVSNSVMQAYQLGSGQRIPQRAVAAADE